MHYQPPHALTAVLTKQKQQHRKSYVDSGSMSSGTQYHAWPDSVSADGLHVHRWSDNVRARRFKLEGS
jgi:hypothetical protein